MNSDSDDSQLEDIVDSSSNLVPNPRIIYPEFNTHKNHDSVNTQTYPEKAVVNKSFKKITLIALLITVLALIMVYLFANALNRRQAFSSETTTFDSSKFHYSIITDSKSPFWIKGKKQFNVLRQQVMIKFPEENNMKYLGCITVKLVPQKGKSIDVVAAVLYDDGIKGLYWMPYKTINGMKNNESPIFKFGDKDGYLNTSFVNTYVKKTKSLIDLDLSNNDIIAEINSEIPEDGYFNNQTPGNFPLEVVSDSKTGKFIAISTAINADAGINVYTADTINRRDWKDRTVCWKYNLSSSSGSHSFISSALEKCLGFQVPAR